ncbi:MAG TPA: hypothetical protein VHU18_05965 [Rhizomicrobium sp.]|jgi:hypothetical protein|nr:hypothetical protein [Rhizomicrobium sp.]
MTTDDEWLAAKRAQIEEQARQANAPMEAQMAKKRVEWVRKSSLMSVRSGALTPEGAIREAAKEGVALTLLEVAGAHRQRLIDDPNFRTRYLAYDPQARAEMQVTLETIAAAQEAEQAAADSSAEPSP